MIARLWRFRAGFPNLGSARRRVDKMPSELIQYPPMRHVYRIVLLCAGVSVLLLTGCATGGHVSAGGPYHVTAYKPNDPSKVRVLVSLSKENVYVMEGDRCLMAAAISVGMPSKPTPRGNFHIYSKQEHKRSGSYGLAYRAIESFRPRVVERGATSDIRWDIGVSSRPRTAFTRASSIPHRERMGAFV